MLQAADVIDFLVEWAWTTAFWITLPGIAVYFISSGILYYYFYKYHSHKYFPEGSLDKSGRELGVKLKGKTLRGQIWEEMKLSVITVTAGGPLGGFFQTLMNRGYSRVYYDINDYGWGYFFLSIVIFVAFTETCVYWIHRWLHEVRWLYKYIHKPHHSFIVTTPWAAWAFHPLDSFSQAFPHFIFPFICPIHHGLHLVDMLYLSVWAALIHDQTSFTTLGGIVLGSTHHEVHHLYLTKNYGQWTTFWDRFMNSYQKPLPESTRLANIKEAATWAAGQNKAITNQ